jgi:hypothetical protein
MANVIVFPIIPRPIPRPEATAVTGEPSLEDLRAARRSLQAEMARFLSIAAAARKDAWAARVLFVAAESARRAAEGKPDCADV